jgi:hypothetical protein
MHGKNSSTLNHMKKNCRTLEIESWESDSVELPIHRASKERPILAQNVKLSWARQLLRLVGP